MPRAKKMDDGGWIMHDARCTMHGVTRVRGVTPTRMSLCSNVVAKDELLSLLSLRLCGAEGLVAAAKAYGNGCRRVSCRRRGVGGPTTAGAMAVLRPVLSSFNEQKS